ncbi:MAG TPA: hypothetical protein VFK05_03720 [Polyangiaceae bacterium]|nr:hypothetical protein [Polyangiaceae bacterium]
MTSKPMNLTLRTLLVPLALCLASGCALSSGSEEELAQSEEAVAATGGDFPGSRCIRNNKDGTSTSGKCEDVCKDKTVYAPHPSEDPAGTKGICYEAAKVLVGRGNIGNIGIGTIQSTGPGTGAVFAPAQAR